jgi:hypothetical protein
MSPDKRLTLVARAVGIAMAHFFVFMTAVAFSIVESGGRPFFAQALIYVLGFPLVPLLFLLPADVAFFQSRDTRRSSSAWRF